MRDIGPCLCGALDCWSCGPAQGYPRGRRAYAAWEAHEERRKAWLADCDFRELLDLLADIHAARGWRGDYHQAALLTEVAEAVDRDSEYEAEDADYDEDDGGDAA